MYKVDLDLTSSKTAENSVTVIFIVFFGGVMVLMMSPGACNFSTCSRLFPAFN